MAPPKYPAGEHVPDPAPSPERRAESIETLGRLPDDLRKLVDGLSDGQLSAKYVNWNVRQIVSHLADSHMNAFSRFKLSMTEDNPTVRPYKQWEWSQLADADDAPVASIQILEGLHARWVRLLRSMSAEDFARTFFHPEYDATYTLDSALDLYAWHGRHHAAQVEWLAGRPA